ncbi:hypothetical protein [Deinococcus sp. Leaf326]|uniref:RCC1 domain-containing protein n=1 Tax=Deinococcus sp. Leaf326 TaxID=1736338 RepID=UPI00138F2F82|nr:hypothetical protein [Deinococcus sp. Leaf326]
MTATVPTTTLPVATAPGTPAQQALPGVFQIDFTGVGTSAPTSQVQSLPSSGLGAQDLVSAPDQFSFSRVLVQTFAVEATGIRHIRVTYKVTNNTGQTLRNPKFVAVVPQGSPTDSVFTNVWYFDGSDASASISTLSLVQGQTINASTNTAIADPQANAVLTGLDVSTVDITGKGIKTLSQTGWWLTTPPSVGGTTLMASGDSAFITFGVNVPMTAAANGGAAKDPFSFSLNVTAVQDALPLAVLSSAVKQWNTSTRALGNYEKFPTRTYTQNGVAVTRSLPAYYDLSNVNGSTTAKVLCAGDANMSVTNISTASFPNRWRVQLLSLGEHSLKVFEGMTCPASGRPVLSQTVTGVGNSETSISTSWRHSLALRADGTVIAWGDNTYKQLGVVTPASKLPPVQVENLSGITSVSAGTAHNLALRADGTVQSWGDNSSGELGDGTTTQRPLPVPVQGLSDIVSVATGSSHSLALRADGTVFSWGAGGYGALGDGTTTQRLLPATIPGLSGVMSISASFARGMALKGDGTVWGWGYNRNGELGDGTLTDRTAPVAMSGLSGVMSISAGGNYTLALKADGTVWGSGSNGFGELGDGTGINRSTPVMVSGLSGVTSIAAGDAHSLALKADGTGWSWGRNDYGQLGDGTTINRKTPVAVSGLSGMTRLAGGQRHSVALTADGMIWTWGDNFYVQLGDYKAQRNTPASIGWRAVQPMP